MAAFQIESGVCNGRGFAAADVNGYLAKLYTWIQLAPGAGGPGWTILRDRSANPAAVTVTPDHTTENFNAVAHGFTTGEKVRFASTGALPGNISGATDYYIIKVDADNFKLATTYAKIWNSTYHQITANGSGTITATLIGPYITVSDNAAPATANTVCMILQIGMKTLEAGYVEAYSFLSWDDTNKVPKALWAGRRLATLDDADFAYDFRGGDEQMILQSRIGVDWDTFVLDTFLGDSNLVEGTDKRGTVQGAIVAGDDVTIEVGAGEGANFTADKFYYLYDFITFSSYKVNYVNVTKVGLADGLPSADHIQVERLDFNYQANAVIAAYDHRYYSMGNLTGLNLADYSRYKNNMPYASTQDAGEEANHQQHQNIVLDYNSDRMNGYLNKMSPNDEGLYAVQRPGITENHEPNDYNSYDGMNRAYGIMKNVYATSVGIMARGQDGRIISGDNYLYFQKDSDLNEGGVNSLALLFQDFEEVV